MSSISFPDASSFLCVIGTLNVSLSGCHGPLFTTSFWGMRINRNRFKPLSLNLEHSSQSGPAHLFSFLCKVVSPGSPFIPQLIKCWHSWLVTGQPANPGETGKTLLCWECGPTSWSSSEWLFLSWKRPSWTHALPVTPTLVSVHVHGRAQENKTDPTFQILLDCLALIFTLSLVFWCDGSCTAMSTNEP